jgi:hypothetical protein
VNEHQKSNFMVLVATTSQITVSCLTRARDAR